MISIITPVYNGQRFIESCIRVVIDQKCVSAEHVIVDGGSTDGTVDMIRRYASDHPHIRWVSEKDRGQSDAMNKGIAIARGEIIGFLNVDDFYEPGVLNRVVELFAELPDPSLVVGNCNVWNSRGDLWWVNRPQKLKLTQLLLGPSINPFPVNPSAYFYHASLHKRVGHYDVDDHYAMDLDFLLRAVQVATTKYFDEPWGNFSLIEGTKTLTDINSGTMLRRQEWLLNKYRRVLPFHQRLHVAIVSPILQSRLWNTIRYFSGRPQELPTRLVARIRDALGASC